MKPVLKRWARGDDLWLTRVALLHQLNYRADTDAGWLFALVAQRGGHGRHLPQRGGQEAGGLLQRGLRPGEMRPCIEKGRIERHRLFDALESRRHLGRVRHGGPTPDDTDL